MTDNEFLLEKLENACSECEIHIKRANYALIYIQNSFPLTEESYGNIKEHDEACLEKFELSNNTDYSTIADVKIEYFDQFIYRYTKLQDTIGKSILTPLCSLLEYNTDSLSFIDIINIAEKHGIIENVQIWNKLRSLRNNISHEYDNEISYQVTLLNEIFESYKTLLVIFNNIKEILKKITLK